MMQKQFTGRHMWATMIAFFGTVIGVNFYMASQAIGTFGGTVVDNSYVASQHFNEWLAEGREQAALGWTVTVDAGADRRMKIKVSDAAGPLASAMVDVTARNPLGSAPATRFLMTRTSDGHYVAERPLPAGRWQVRVTVRRGGAKLTQLAELS